MNKKPEKGENFLMNNSRHIKRNNSKNKIIRFMNVNNILTNTSTEPITLRYLLKNNKSISKNKYKTTNTSRNRKLKKSKPLSKLNISSISNPRNINKNLRLFSSTTYNKKILQKANSNLINKTYLMNTHFKSNVKIKDMFYSITSPSKDFNTKVKQIDFTKNINKKNIASYKAKKFSKDLVSLNTKESTFSNGKNYGNKNPDFFQKYDSLRIRAKNLFNKYSNLIEHLNKNLRKIKYTSNSYCNFQNCNI